MRRLVLVALASALSACDRGGEGKSAALETPPLETAEQQRIYVCRAANALFNEGAPGSVASAEAAGEAKVRVVYAPQDGVTWTTECAFSGDQVTWRLTGAGVPAAGIDDLQAQRPERTARWALTGNQVKLTWTQPDGAVTASIWKSSSAAGAR